MIYAERPKDSPASLTGAAATAEQQEAVIHYGTWAAGDKAYTFKHYKAYDVVAALERLFHSKCAYCERKIEKGSREVEHYRPKGGTEDEDHPGYWWLAHSWTNLLPTCGPCNKGLHQHLVTIDMTVTDVEALQATKASKLMGKANSFPVGAARLQATSEDHEIEQPHLIDPTRTDPGLHLQWNHHTPYSIVTPKADNGQTSIEGTETIRCLALNRYGLVESRTSALQILTTQGERIRRHLDASVGLEPEKLATVIESVLETIEDMRLHCSPDKQFAAMSTAYVIELREFVGLWLETHGPADGAGPPP